MKQTTLPFPGLNANPIGLFTKKLFFLILAMLLFFVTVKATPAAITGTTTIAVGSTTTLSDATTGGTWMSSNLSIATVGSLTGVVSGLTAGTCNITYTAGGSYVYTTMTVSTVSSSHLITTFAGNGTAGYSGDGSAAIAGELSDPYAVAVDGSGNVYIADKGNNCIRKVNTSGIITTFAGNGTAGYSGDGGPASSAKLDKPTGVACDISGNVYIADQVNNCIRKVNTSGIIKTFAGNGTAGYTGDGSAATAAELNQPINVASDFSGNLFIVDFNNSAIRKVNSSGIISTVAGNGTCGFSGDGGAATSAKLYHPTMMACDASGNLYIDDENNDRIRKVNTSGVITTIAGDGIDSFSGDGGPATAARLNETYGVCVDGKGNVYIADLVNQRIRKVDTSGIITTICGTGVRGALGDCGPATAAQLYNPYGICIDNSGNIFIADNINEKVRKISGYSSVITGATTVMAGSIITLSNATPGGVWTSSNTSVATIGSLTGIATGVAAGTCTISYNISGCYVYATLTVTAISSITGTSSVCAGSSITLSDATTGGTWSSSNTAVATVGSSTGIVSGISAGTSIISYTIYGGAVTKTVTVNATPSAIAGITTLGSGSSTTLSDCITGGTWTSSNTSVATVGAMTGVVTGVTAGTTNITYSIGGCYVYTTFTVISVSSITGTATVCKGSVTTLSNAITGGTWSSSNTSVATVGASTGVVTGVSAGTSVISYTIYCSTVTKTVTVNAMPTAITGSTTVGTGGATTLSDVITGGTWTSSNTAVATVGYLTGVVNGVSAGTTSITYSIAGCYVYATFTVISVSSIMGTTTVCKGSATTLSNAIAGGTWSSSNSSVATVGLSTGVVTGISAGTSVISYTIYCSTVTKTVTVNAMPSAIIGSTTVGTGGTTTLSDAITGGTWTCSNTSVATIGALTGVVTGVSAGTATISYNINGCYVTATMTVKGISSITGTATVCTGSSITLSDATTGGTWSSSNTAVAIVGSSTGTVSGLAAGTSVITYMVYGSAVTTVVTVNATPAAITGGTKVGVGSKIILTDVIPGGIWTSSDTTVAKVCAPCGFVTGISAGTATITYNIGGCYVISPITVVSISSITGTTTICAGSSTTLSDMTTGGSWTSSNPLVATIGLTTGTVTGIAAGTATISYMVYGGTETTVVTIHAMPAAITGASVVACGGTITLNDATAGGAWTSSNTLTAAIGSLTGVVTGTAAGTSIISYSLGFCFATSLLNVIPIAPITGTTTVCAGNTSTLSDATTGGTWSSSDTSIATINPTSGLMYGVSAGTSIISYNIAGYSRTIIVTINDIPTVGAVSGFTMVSVGNSINLTCFSSGGSIAWTSSNSSIASVNSMGTVTGVSNGTAIITYSVTDGCGTSASTITITVYTGITGSIEVCTGGTTTLLHSISGGTWSSSNTSIATINSGTGVLTGISAGTAYITYEMGGTVIVTVTVLPLPSVTGTVTNASCNGYANGNIEISVSGGSTRGTWLYYSYLWSNGATTDGAWALTPGIYSVIATDPNGCSGTASFTVSEPSPLVTSGIITDTLLGCRVGKIDLTVSGGTSPYTYTWSNGETTQDIYGLLEGEYVVDITDSNNCQSTGWYYIEYCTGCHQDGVRRTNNPTAVVPVNANDIPVKAYPNPFTSKTNITFTTPVSGQTIVEVINPVTGVKVGTIFNEHTNAGSEHSCVLNGDNLSPGIYLYNISVGNATYTGKVILVK